MVSKDDDKSNGVGIIELKTLSQVIKEDESSPSIPMDEFEEDTENLLLSSTAVTGSRVGLCEFLCAYISLFMINKPKHSAVIVCILLLALAITVNVTLENDKPRAFELEEVIETDYSSVQSKYDLSMGKIDHWCLTGGNKNCNCEDPTLPVSKMQYRFWKQTHTLNLNSIDEYLANLETGLDVAFIGENIVESWAGRSIGIRTAGMKPMQHLFEQYFHKEGGGNEEKGGGKFNGLPLGIAGDTAPNVLWRILHGEIPYYLNPKVFWIVIGTNDLAIKQCSEEVVLLGILRVIEEIQSIRPDAKIVVNSIIPMTDDVKGRVPTIAGGNHKRTRILQTDDLFEVDDMDMTYYDDYDGSDKFDDDDVLREDDYYTEDDIFGGLTDDYDVVVPEVSEEEEEKAEESIINFHPTPPLAQDQHMPTINIHQAFKRVPVAMWPSVVAINAQLKKFCSKHKHITFFDSYDIFVDRGDRNDKKSVPTLKKEYYSSFFTGTPSVEGSKALLEAISNRLDHMMKKNE